MSLRPGTVEEIARALGGAVPTTAGYKCRCPAHGDTNPSLIINFQGSVDGRPTVKCMAGCSTKDIFAAIEEKTGMMFADRDKKPFADPKTEHPKPERRKAIFPAPIELPDSFEARGLGAPTKIYRYYNDKSELMFAIGRWDTPNDPRVNKQIRQLSVQMYNGQPTWQLGGLSGVTNRPVYNLPELLDRPNAPVLVVEGEKAADRAKTLPEFAEFVVITWSQGASNSRHTDWSVLRGRRVYLWPDNDYNNVSYEFFVTLGKQVGIDGMAEEVHIAHVPRTWPNKWDLGDVLPKGAKYSDVVWHQAPKTSWDDILKSLTPSNYHEVFSSLFKLYYDGKKRSTIDLKRYHFSKGCAVALESPGITAVLNHHHPFWRSLAVKGNSGLEPAIMTWADQKFEENDVVHGFNFFPGDEATIVEEAGVPYMNSWTGWKFKPTKTGRCELFKAFVREVICNEDPVSFNYLWNFIAHIFQFPQERPTVAIILKGDQGTGKGTFFDMLYELLGGYQGYAQQMATTTHLTDKFNGSMIQNSLALFIAELEITKSRTAENIIKNLVTDQYIRAERKYHDAQTIKNLVRVFGATNHEHVWNVGNGERRLSMFELPSTHAQDREYFKAIRAEMMAGGFGRLFYELMETEVNKQLVHTALQNDAKRRQSLYTRTPAREIAMKFLKNKEIEFKILDERKDTVMYYHASESTWLAGEAFMPSKMARRLLDDLISRRGFHDDTFSAKDPRASVIGLVKLLGGTGEYTTKTVLVRGVREAQACYKLPPFSVSLDAFCNDVGLSIADVFDDNINNNVVEFPNKTDQRQSDTPF